jgi:hypothetical protein
MYNRLEKIRNLDGKPYFPFLLGNGADSVFIDYSGSMHCLGTHLHTEQHQGVICGWHKGPHRDFQKPILPLLQSTYTLFSGSNSYEIGSFDQHFDPQSAVLTTKAETAFCKFSVETFLTSDQILVEHYVFEKVDAEVNPAIGFNLHVPFNFFRGLSSAGQCDCTFNVSESNKTIECSYSIGGIDGFATMLIDCPDGTHQTGVARFGIEQGANQGRCLQTSLGATGTILTRYLILLDETDTPHYRQELERRIANIKSSGYQAILAAHHREWTEHEAQSKVSLPDSRLQYLYDLGFYLIKSNQHPETGTISLGNYPALWGGGVSCADICSPRSYLAGNRINEVQKFLEGYVQGLPLARRYAQEFGAEGAYFPWFANNRGVSLDWSSPLDSPHHERFNNALIPIYVWDLYRYTGDSEILRHFWPILQEPIDFLLSSTVDETENDACISAVEGLYEADAPFKNNLGHLLPLIKALEVLLDAGKILDRSLPSRYVRILGKLLESRERDYGGHEIAHNAITTLELLTVSLYLLPELCFSPETLDLMLEDRQESLGLATARGPYRNLVWPEEEFKAALVFAHMGRGEEAFQHLENGAVFSTSLGIIPEKIRPDGYPINYYYLLSQSTYIVVLQSMLAFERDGLKLLPAIPAHWTELAFDNLRVSPGVLISLRLEAGKVHYLKLRNATGITVNQTIEIDFKYLIEADAMGWSNSISIPAGQEITLIENGLLPIRK